MQRSLIGVVVLCLGVCVFMQGAYSNARTPDELGVAVSPQTLLLSSDQGGEVTVHTAVPYRDVDTSSLTLNGIPVRWTKADARGNLVAKFDEAQVKAIAAPPSLTLTLSGNYKDGSGFSGSDTVQVRP